MLEIKGHRTDQELLVARAIVCESMDLSLGMAYEMQRRVNESLTPELQACLQLLLTHSMLSGASVALQWVCHSERSSTLTAMIREYIAEHGEPDLTKD